MPPRDLPKSLVSVASQLDNARMSAPSAVRNTEPLTDLLRHHAPQSGKALELASGTGEHALAFAQAFPNLIWQPTEIDAARRASIDAWAATANPDNLRPAIPLDATRPRWGAAHAGHDLIFLVNLLHLISTPEARRIIAEVPGALAPGGRFIFYGPFLRDGKATSEGDARFHASLRAADPETGYKNDADVISWLQGADLCLVDIVEMPANNLAFVSERPKEP